MPPIYDQLIARTDVQGLMPEPVVVELQQDIARTSIVASLFRQIPMSSGQVKTAVLDALPYAYWVNGDTGLKQTTKVSWTGKYLTAEELAVIVPVPEAVIADVNVDIFARLRPLLADAFAMVLDSATVFGVNRPATFAQAIVPGAAAATPTQAIVNADVVAGIDEALSLLEGNDVNVNGIVARAAVRGAVRRALTQLGGASSLGAAPNDLFGYPLVYPSGTLGWPANLQTIMGDWTCAVLGVRQDITYKVLSESVISDDAGKVIFNLAQQDAVALRAVARYAFAVADHVGTGADGQPQSTYPFATTATA